MNRPADEYPMTSLPASTPPAISINVVENGTRSPVYTPVPAPYLTLLVERVIPPSSHHAPHISTLVAELVNQHNMSTGDDGESRDDSLILEACTDASGEGETHLVAGHRFTVRELSVIVLAGVHDVIRSAVSE